MKRREWQERRDLQRARAETGYTHVRLTRGTVATLEQLRSECAGVTSMDELIYELALAELDRRGVRPRFRAAPSDGPPLRRLAHA